MQPERALDGWRKWGAGLRARPVLAAALGGGRSNRSFLLDSDIGRLVLRINNKAVFLPGHDRNDEFTAWRAANQRGIAPPLVYADAGQRFLVSAYIDNELPQNPQSDPAVIDRAFELLQGCHQLDAAVSRIDYLSHVDHYWSLIEAKKHRPDPGLLELRRPMQQALESLIDSDTPRGLCHHDPVIQNFVGSAERLYLIDWEYAAIGLQIMDYAALASEWQLDEATVVAKTGVNQEQLTMAKAVYFYLCLLWEAVSP